MKRLTAGAGALAMSVLLLLPSAVLGSSTLPRAQLRAFTCQRALDPANRSVSVTAVMRPMAQTRRLQVKFDLLVARGMAAPRKLVRAGDLGVWINPKNATLGRLPGDVWNLQKPVVELAAPATYRFRVQFRWLGAHRHLLGTAVHYSRSCRQTELRPDLLVHSIAVSAVADHPAEALYTAKVENAGNSAAGPFDVLFAPADGSHTETHTVAVLKAHRSLSERFVGPACTATTVPTITADSASQVDDLNRSNNQLTAVCPASPSG